MASTHKINFHPNPVQKQFIESRAKADLFASRMGEGKSTSLSWATLAHSRHNPGARWALIRDTWINMEATTQKTFFEWFPPQIMGEYKASTKTFKWASGIADGEVQFLGMDAPEDASTLMSRELAGFGVDEPAPAVGSNGVDEMIFDIGMGRLRQPGMKWYGAKLAVNNPDETHWTYKRFVQPGHPEFALWQPAVPENMKNLPDNYYEQLRSFWAHRPDLIRRFVDGEFGYQQDGKAVTPQWSDKIHLATGLVPMARREVIILWDFGLNPTAILTQVTPLGSWLILDALVGDGIGVAELIEDAVAPLLSQRYPNSPRRHIGDPQGKQREQSSALTSAVSLLQKRLGGPWRSGPQKPTILRVSPLQAVLRKNGVVKVDRQRASAVWLALRGGWHYHVSRTGITSGEPVKDMHSHPGDAMGYGAAVLFPMAKLPGTHAMTDIPSASYWEQRSALPMDELRIGPQNRLNVPAHGTKLILPSDF